MKNAFATQDAEGILRCMDNMHINEQDIAKEVTVNREEIIRYIKSVERTKRQLRPMGEVYDEARQSEEKFKHKFKLRDNTYMVEYFDGQPVLSINWDFYKEILKKSEKYKFYNKMDKIIGNYDAMAEVQNMIKKCGPELNENWHMYVDITTLFGWKKQPEGDEIWEKVLKWVNEEFKPQYKGSEIRFNELFREKVRKVLRSGSRDNIPIDLTPEDFVNNIPLVGTTGSAYDVDGKVMQYEIGDKVLKGRKNKYAKALYYTVKQKVDKLLGRKKGMARVSVKMEFFPKVRTIINAGFQETIKMRYIDTWLQPFLRGSKLSTLWQTKEDLYNMWVSMANELGKWSVPIDQSAFDYHVSREMVMIMIDEIKELIVEFGRGSQKEKMIEVIETLKYTVSTTEVEYTYMGKRYTTTWKNGVLSGWQWTAMFDTIANIAEGMMAKELVEEETSIKIKEVVFNAQGDDQLMVVETVREAVAYWAAFSTMGFEINLKKNFFSTRHNEYLRKYSVKNEVNGYAARMVNAMLWVYPGDVEVTKQLEKVTSMKDNWVKFAQRMKMGWKDIKKLFIRDASRAKINKELLTSLVSGDPINGGFGMEKPYNNKKIDVIKGQYVGITGARNDEGYKQFKNQFGFGQESELDKWTESVVAPFEKQKVQGIAVEIKQPDEVVIKEAQYIKEVQFAFIKNVSVSKPELNRPYTYGLIFGTSDELLEKAFGPINNLYERNAPKRWVKDFITNKLKYNTPQISNMSIEMSSLVWSMFKGSMEYAMLMKGTRGHNKWEGLMKYANKNFEQFWIESGFNTGISLY